MGLDEDAELCGTNAENRGNVSFRSDAEVKIWLYAGKSGHTRVPKGKNLSSMRTISREGLKMIIDNNPLWTLKGERITVFVDTRRRVVAAWEVQKARDPKGRWSLAKFVSRAINQYGAKDRSNEEALKNFVASEYHL